MNRTTFLVDGFNLYHSLIDAQKVSKGAKTRWLNLASLCSSFLPISRRIVGERASLKDIYYFSAPPIHRSQEKLDRHAAYMRCLTATGVKVELSRFKSKHVFCSKCKEYFIAHEEKETDVAIAARLFEECYAGKVDTIILMTGDTDLAPAVSLCKRLFSNKSIFFAFPYKRRNNELARIAPESFSIRKPSYSSHQLSNPFVLEDETQISKPNDW